MVWKPKVKTFQIIVKNIPNNTKIHIPMNACYLYIRVENKMPPFDLRFQTHWEMWFPCYMSDIKDAKNIILIHTTNKILLIAVKQTMLCLSGRKINKCLATYLVLICKFTHIPFSTKSCKHIFLCLLWDKLRICSIANIRNTHRLH